MGHLTVAQIEATPDGGSRWLDVEVPFVAVEGFAQDIPVVDVAELGSTGAASIVRVPVGWKTDFHPSPRDQLLIVLRGRVEVTTSDGEQRTFGPGQLFVYRDTTGRGHSTTVVGEEESLTAFVALGS